MTAETDQKAASQPYPEHALRNRYVFSGTLRMTTGLHIGGGKFTLSNTDSPVVLTPEGLPFIPGSSLKGVLRSTIEKIVASLPADLGLHSCGLLAEDETDKREDELCPTAHQKAIAQDKMVLKREDLCHTCRLFGSPFAAGRIKINDLTLIEDEWDGIVQVRDGVAIDRDKEIARHGGKYDFEVVPSTTGFAMYMLIENATSQDLQLISIGLSEFTSGFIGIGGLRSRGLGACILDPLVIRALELDKQPDEQARKARLRRYLLRNKEKHEDGLDPLATQAFFEDQINALFRETSTGS